MTGLSSVSPYFRHVLPISARQWHLLGLGTSLLLIAERKLSPIIFYRHLALSLNKAHHASAPTVYAAHLNLCAVLTLGDALRAPVEAAPVSLADQIRFVRDTWHAVLPPELLAELATALDILLEEERERGWGGGPGPPPVLEFRHAGQPGGGMRPDRGDSIFAGFDYPEYERFSQDADWMSNVVLMSKMVYVWLDQMSRSHGYPITRLDQIPDAELDRLATRGFTGLWLIGLWERSPASQRIKQICGNPDAIASAYSLYDYEVVADLGGWEALANLRERADRRGIRLASDMVPNHTDIYSRWMVQQELSGSTRSVLRNWESGWQSSL